MGIHSKYICSNCSYVFEGSRGMLSFVYDTYNCLDCKKTFDYFVDEIPGYFIKKTLPRTALAKLFLQKEKYINEFVEERIPNHEIKCTCCKNNNVIAWEYNCPCCNHKMKNTEIIEFWD